MQGRSKTRLRKLTTKLGGHKIKDIKSPGGKVKSVGQNKEEGQALALEQTTPASGLVKYILVPRVRKNRIGHDNWKALSPPGKTRLIHCSRSQKRTNKSVITQNNEPDDQKTLKKQTNQRMRKQWGTPQNAREPSTITEVRLCTWPTSPCCTDTTSTQGQKDWQAASR